MNDDEKQRLIDACRAAMREHGQVILPIEGFVEGFEQGRAVERAAVLELLRRWGKQADRDHYPEAAIFLARAFEVVERGEHIDERGTP
jgi:hypothetical protein